MHASLSPHALLALCKPLQPVQMVSSRVRCSSSSNTDLLDLRPGIERPPPPPPRSSPPIVSLGEMHVRHRRRVICSLRSVSFAFLSHIKYCRDQLICRSTNNHVLVLCPGLTPESTSINLHAESCLMQRAGCLSTAPARALNTHPVTPGQEPAPEQRAAAASCSVQCIGYCNCRPAWWHILSATGLLGHTNDTGMLPELSMPF